MDMLDPSLPCKCEDGISPHIDGETGNWFIGEEDTGVQAKGEDGINGKDGECDCDNVKIPICHKGQNLEVPLNALGAHLNHGDTIGLCPVTIVPKIE